MKRPIIASAILLLLSGCVSVRIEEASAGHVIVPVSQQYGYVLRGQQEWTPEDGDIVTLEKEIGLLFAKPDQRMKGFLLTRNGSPPRKAPFPLSDYYVRYCGVIRDGKKLIIGSAVQREQQNAKRYLNAPIFGNYGVGDSVAGGGTFYFTVTFDAGARSLLELQYNGPM